MPNNRGFAIALDALMAIILVTALLVFLSQQPDLPSPGIDTSKRLKEITHNAFATLENSGILGDYLVERIFDVNSARDINREAKKLVPGNVDLKVKITAFQATTDMAYCRNQQRFETCFDTPNAIVSVAGKEPPTGKEIVYGKKILAIRQPGGETKGPNGEVLCTMQGELAQKKTEKPFSYAWFDANTASIEFQAYAHSNSMACASTMPPTGGPPDNPPDRVAEYSTVTLKARNQTRDPLDVYLILDKSGSMSQLDMNLQNPASGQFNEGKCLNSAYQSVDCTPDITISGNCGNYSIPGIETWIPVGSFDLSQETYNRLMAGNYPPNNNIAFWNQYTSGSGYQCSNPKIRIKQPGTGTYFYAGGGTSMDSAWIAAWVHANQATIGTWGIELWADQPTQITRPLSVSMWKGFRLATIINGGAVPGVPKDSSCIPNESDWRSVGTISITDPGFHTLSATVNHNYDYPEGVCGVGARLKNPSGVVVGTFGPSKNSPVTVTYGTSWDDPLSDSPPYDPVLFPTGDYNVEAWADRTVTISSIVYEHKVFVSKIEPITIPGLNPPEPYPTVAYDAGLCSSPPATCTASTIIYGTCILNGPDYTTNADLSSYEISASPRGMRADITNYNYQGVCTNQVYKIINPSGTAVVTVAGAKPSGNKCMTINRNNMYDNNPAWPGSGACTDATSTLSPGTWKVQGWSDSQSPFMVTWKQQKIDAAQYAASNFIDNNNWKFEDTIGTITFSDTAQELRSLLHMDDINREILKGDMDGIEVNGETNIYSSISLARSQLNSIGKNARQFIILLSDGLANLPPPPQDPLQLAIDEARDAYGFDRVVTYTVAFGMDAIDWNAQVGAWQCKQPLTLIAIAGGGKCYPANDPQQLVEIYNLIANQIQQQLGKTDLEMPLYPGQWINNPTCNPSTECGLDPNPDCPQGIYLRRHTNWEPEIFDDFCWSSIGNWYQAGNNESIVFKDILINQIGDWWDANFNVAWPCGGEHCFEEMTFPITNDLEPRKGTRVTITDLPIVPWPTDNNSGFPEQQTLSIRTRDLGVKFLDGNIFSNKTNLRVRLQNLQDLNINLNGHQEAKDGYANPPPCAVGEIEVRFFRNTSPEPPDFNRTPTLSVCINPDANTDDVMIPLEFKDFMEQIQNGEGGYIFVEINPNRGTNPIFQCKENDYDKIFCFAEPAIKYFLLEYWSWLK